jgi:Vam6/Vps39-like protein vacuolar protein sorting-associated protein 39
LDVTNTLVRYCKRVYRPNEETSNVFLTLLRIYLRPTVKTSADLLQPALDLISRHSPRLDAIETLNLLPPLVTAQDVRTFLIEALRAPVFDTRVIREISKSRNDQLARKLMLLQTKRVKVTDSRMYVIQPETSLIF